MNVFDADESREIRNYKNNTSGTSMERLGNASHDDNQKLTDKSKNKNTTKATATLLFPNLPYIMVAM